MELPTDPLTTVFVVDPDEPCPCGSGDCWATCCARYLPLTLRYVPVRLLEPGDPVACGCRRGGHCCHNVHVPLTPFDVLRIATRLEMENTSFLEEFAVVTPEGGVELEGIPHCPFLDGSSCAIYEDRPDSCRMYPFWSVPLNGTDYLVERHTCAGCWEECRSERLPAGELLERSGVRVGQAAEALYQAALQELEAAGVSEPLVEQFMSRVYTNAIDPAASEPGPGAGLNDGVTPGREEQFRRMVERLKEEYLRHDSTI